MKSCPGEAVFWGDFIFPDLCDSFFLQSPVSQPQDYTKENLIRIGVSVLVLVLLGILLYEDQHSQRRVQYTASREKSASVKVGETSE